MKGVEKKNVFAIRRLDDTKKIADVLPQVKNVAVIGGVCLAWRLPGN